jgi:hypothetical protein
MVGYNYYSAKRNVHLVFLSQLWFSLPSAGKCMICRVQQLANNQNMTSVDFIGAMRKRVSARS